MLKISLPGFDVKEASPEQLAVDSTFDTLKLPISNSNPYFGEIFVTFAGNPDVGTYPVFSYKHGFDYNPFYYVFLDTSQSANTLLSNSSATTGTQFSPSAGFTQYFMVSQIPGGFKMDYVVNSITADVTGAFYSFKYFVFVNEGVA